MIKAVKKLKKLWLRKKTRKKIHQYKQPHYRFPPPPLPCYHCCSHTTAAQPSAPPLPPWLEPAKIYEEDLKNGLRQHYSFHDPRQGCEEIVVETNSISPTLHGNASTEYWYQQYMEPNPVYGVPVVEVAGRKRQTGFLDCVVKFGANLIRCLCPCFHVREANEIIVA